MVAGSSLLTLLQTARIYGYPALPHKLKYLEVWEKRNLPRRIGDLCQAIGACPRMEEV